MLCLSVKEWFHEKYKSLEKGPKIIVYIIIIIWYGSLEFRSLPSSPL